MVAIEEFFPYDNADSFEDEWRKMARLWLPTGVHYGELNNFECYGDGTGTQTVGGTADDGAGSGIALVEVSTDGATWQDATGTQAWTVDVAVAAGVTGDTWTLYVRATDYHSQTATFAFTYTLDTTAPVIAPTD